jgi:transketolase
MAGLRALPNISIIQPADELETKRERANGLDGVRHRSTKRCCFAARAGPGVW